MIQEQIDSICQKFSDDLENAQSLQQLSEIKVKYLGKKGILKDLIVIFNQSSNNEKPIIGKLINQCKDYIEESLKKAHIDINDSLLREKFEKEKIDVTLPGTKRFLGREHILKRSLYEMTRLFSNMGFVVREAPNIETEENNFSKLNFEDNHPARDMQDTFYLDQKYLLRTHTSNAQIRTLLREKPPLRVVSPGVCFRNEDVSMRSHMLFHQVEAFYVDKNVSLADLLAVLKQFFLNFFNNDILFRFRHSYFPFVEPGLEVDINCIKCQQKGCSLCKYTGWLEVAGAGMIHPNVLSNVNIDFEKFSGFAIGIGVERLVMLRHDINDIRLFMENDKRFLDQF